MASRDNNAMNGKIKIPLVASLLIFGFIQAFASDIKIVANPNIRTDFITAAELRGIFLQDRRSLDGSRVEPVLAKGGAAHEAFLRRYLGKSDGALHIYYRTLIFTGTGVMPKFLDSDTDIVRYVAKTRGALGYVSIDFPAPGVKVLAISEATPSPERQLVTRIEPDYPQTLEHLLIGGTVRLNVTISPRGSVENIQLLGGNPALAEAAIRAVKQWVYAPAPSQTVEEVSIPFVPR
jgi:TonB family protein